MIYDCFTFFNELDLLELRLNELDDTVDRFVLVEATKSFSNLPKKLLYAENRERFSTFSNKIIHIIVDDFPDYDGNAWEYETFQRNAIARGLVDCAPEDVIIISDVDEIPNKKAIRRYNDLSGVYSLNQRCFYYFLNCFSKKEPYDWAPCILRYQDFTSAQKLRIDGHTHRMHPVLEEGGWHFSYLGDVETIIDKIESFSHQEFNKAEFKDRAAIARRISSGKDLFERKGRSYRIVDIDDSYPAQVINNRHKYKRYIAELSVLDRFVASLTALFR